MLRVIGPLLLVFGTAVFLSLQALERIGEERMQDDVALVARALRLPLAHALERDREGSVARALQSAFRIRRVYGAYVYGSDGRRVAAYGDALPDEPPERITELATAGDRIGEYGSAGGRRVYSYFVPLTDSWGQSLGLLQITRRRQDFDDHIAMLRWQALGFLLLGTAVVAVLVLRGHYRAVGGPLRSLGASMGRVAAGDRSHRTRAEGPSELAELAGTFNAMLDALESSAREIEHRRQAQDRLRHRLARAEKLAAVGELSAGVAHELGTPLSVIEGVSQRALRREALPGPLRRSLEEVRTQVRRMEAIVRQLLRFGRAETGQRRSVDPAEIVRGAVAAVSEEARRHGVRVVIEPGTDVPDTVLDARRVEDAVANLLRNGCQASPGGTVRVGWSVSGEDLALEVEDDGPGIPDGIRGRIFEPFFTTKTVGEGTGLGLAVVHGVVEDHGGRIEVDESPLGGARFVLRLPLRGGGPEGEP